MFLLIRNLRKKKGLTQSQLAELILCDRSYISKIENNPSQLNLSFDIIYYIAKALDADYLELINYFAKRRMEYFSE